MRVKTSDVVRLYGYPGTFHVICAIIEGKFWALPFNLEHGGWLATDSSVVEINGQPVPLLSCPIMPPAGDYPHEPQFEYSDGPPENAAEALKLWKRD